MLGRKLGKWKIIEFYDFVKRKSGLTYVKPPCLLLLPSVIQRDEEIFSEEKKLAGKDCFRVSAEGIELKN